MEFSKPLPQKEHPLDGCKLRERDGNPANIISNAVSEKSRFSKHLSNSTPVAIKIKDVKVVKICIGNLSLALHNYKLVFTLNSKK